MVENYCFSRVSEGTLGSFWGSILALFRPSGPLCFPVRQRAFSASGGRAAAATGAAGGFYVSLCLIGTNSGTKNGRKLLCYCFWHAADTAPLEGLSILRCAIYDPVEGLQISKMRFSEMGV